MARVHLQPDVVYLQLEGAADARRRDAHARDAVLHQRTLLVLDPALARQEELGERDLWEGRGGSDMGPQQLGDVGNFG